MKVTGIVRRIDDLAGLLFQRKSAVPAEWAREIPEIFTDREWGNNFKEIPPIGELSAFASSMRMSWRKAADILSVLQIDQHIVVSGAAQGAFEPADRLSFGRTY